MKTIITFCIATLLIGQAIGQDRPAPGAPRPPHQGPNRKQGNEQHKQRLQLTPAQRDQLKKEQEQALEKVLTPDQKKKLKEIRQQQQERKNNMLGKQRQQLKERLSLTDEQATKLQDLQKNFMESMKKNRQQLDQTIAQQRDRAHEMMETHQQSLKKLLSAEQLEKYKTMMRDKMRGGMEQLRGGMEQFRGRRGKMPQRPPMRHQAAQEPIPDAL
jgi:chromosome segregation ATPase